ncbi:MAG: UPF0175 family protein [Imperialibacter sp.]
MTLVIDNTILDNTGLSSEELQLELAIALYKHGKLSIGQACELVSLDKIAFQRELSYRNEYLNYDLNDLSDDLKTIKSFNS